MHHELFLRQKLPEKHPLMSSIIFRDRNLMDSLRCMLVSDTISMLVPTGIPPYIHLYQQQRETQRAVERMPDVLLSGFSKILDEKGISAGALRRDDLKSTIRELLSEAGLYQRTSVQLEPQSETCSGTIIYWQRDGKFHRLLKKLSFLMLTTLVSGTCGGSEMQQ